MRPMWRICCGPSWARGWRVGLGSRPIAPLDLECVAAVSPGRCGCGRRGRWPSSAPMQGPFWVADVLRKQDPLIDTPATGGSLRLPTTAWPAESRTPGSVDPQHKLLPLCTSLTCCRQSHWWPRIGRYPKCNAHTDCSRTNSPKVAWGCNDPRSDRQSGYSGCRSHCSTRKVVHSAHNLHPEPPHTGHLQLRTNLQVRKPLKSYSRVRLAAHNVAHPSHKGQDIDMLRTMGKILLIPWDRSLAERAVLAELPVLLRQAATPVWPLTTSHCKIRMSIRS